MESTNLSNLKFEYSYDTQKDDVASDFYEKALKYAKYYDRISAFFDSKFPKLPNVIGDFANILSFSLVTTFFAP